MARSITVIPAKQTLTQASTENRLSEKIRVAAYCRVSTDQEEQQSSYENQVSYYRTYIQSNPQYEYVDIYADEGITGTSTKKRDAFNRMIEDCRAHKIDLIITKSISRFARNTLDCLNYVRELKGLGIGIIFEKENINTLDAKGEVLLTILSSLAQDESRSISENSAWGIRRRFEQGQYTIATKRFLGYDRDKNGNLVVNPRQAKIVQRLYREFLDGKTTNYIARIFEQERIKNWDGRIKWQTTTLESMLGNEKYKGDAILQKSYTVDFLTKKRKNNNGELRKTVIHDDHEAIIEPWIWEAVQLEQGRRRKYREEHSLKFYSQNTAQNPFSGKVICGSCGKAYVRKGWTSTKGVRKVWQCSERYRVKGVIGCENRHLDEAVLEKAYHMAWNAILENQDALMQKWRRMENDENPLVRYRGKRFQELSAGARENDAMDIDVMLATLRHIVVYEDGVLKVVFLDGTEVACGGE